MASRELKVTRIGNSRGVRLPADTLRRYGIDAAVIMDERSDGILLRPAGGAPSKLTWAETAREMAASNEDWSDWDATIADGLDQIPWRREKARRVAEGKASYDAGRRTKSRR
ncbi:MAG TPA: AbrB/MazE/SpoVT family DNA-binding domain-containing protein [Gemmatimonadales bacterium]|jgi:antitoxin component of MazEF toxin-antitoxin module|nr:AbrB/MazE/SpoVT family DNA-binding domain-containing protein [Gemmatimonadales bacterium]